MRACPRSSSTASASRRPTWPPGWRASPRQRPCAPSCCRAPPHRPLRAADEYGTVLGHALWRTWKIQATSHQTSRAAHLSCYGTLPGHATVARLDNCAASCLHSCAADVSCYGTVPRLALWRAWRVLSLSSLAVGLLLSRKRLRPCRQ